MSIKRDYSIFVNLVEDKVLFIRKDSSDSFTAFPSAKFNKEKFENNLGHLSFSEIKSLIEAKWHKERDFEWFKNYEN